MTEAARVDAPGSIRLPTGAPARYTVLALLATLSGVIGLVPHMPSPLSALLIAVFVGVGPGCATLAWVGRPTVSRLLIVPALGLACVILVTGVAATVGWWAPRGLFSMIALMTAWSTAPNLSVVVRDMVR